MANIARCMEERVDLDAQNAERNRCMTVAMQSSVVKIGRGSTTDALPTEQGASDEPPPPLNLLLDSGTDPASSNSTMGAQASSTATRHHDSKPRVSLRGFERYATMAANASTKVVHSMRVTGDASLLLRHLPLATMRTFNRHPRMRALQLRDEFAMAEIQPLFESLDAFLASDSKLLRVLDRTKAEIDAEWQRFVQQECEIAFDRTTQLPFYLVVWADRESGEARLMLFSDHYMSDGISGMVVLHTILEQVSLLASTDQAAPMEELPLRPSMYSMWLDSFSFSTPLSEWLVARLQSTILNQFGEKGGYKALIPVRSDQADWSVPPSKNPSYALFDEGDPKALADALAKCKQEHTTYGGALIAAVVAAYYHSADLTGHLRQEKSEPFKLVASANYNMRKRVPTPAEEDQVGSFFTVSNLANLAKVGVNVHSTKFWDLARTSKKDMDAAISGPTSALMEIFLDQTLTSNMTPEMFAGIPIPRSFTTDINISSIGRYPYATSHQVDGREWLAVESVHIYDSVPHLAGSMFFVTSVCAANYSMMHKHEDAAGLTVFRSLVAVSEHLSGISSDATIAEVLETLGPEIQSRLASTTTQHSR